MRPSPRGPSTRWRRPIPISICRSSPWDRGPFRFAANDPGEALELVAELTATSLAHPKIRRIDVPDRAGSGGGRAGPRRRRHRLATRAAGFGLRHDPRGPGPAVRRVPRAELPRPSYFNLHPESGALFVDRNLRQALAFCFDKPATAEQATNGGGQAIYSEIPPASWAYPSTGLNEYPMDQPGPRSSSRPRAG